MEKGLIVIKSSLHTLIIIILWQRLAPKGEKHIGIFCFYKWYYIGISKTLRVFVELLSPKRHQYKQHLKPQAMNAITKYILIILLGGLSYIQAQTTATIRGTVLDEKKQPLFTALAKIYSDSIYVSGADANLDGIYNVKNLNPGTYNVHISMMGYQTQIIRDVRILAGQTEYIDVTLQPYTKELPMFVARPHIKPIIDKDFGNVKYIPLEDLNHSVAPKNNTVGLITSTNTDMIPTDDGKDVYTRGSRRGTTQFIVDGMKTTNFNVPSQAIGGLVIVPSGIPAEFGDLTGGVVIITTKDYMMMMRQKRMMYEDYYAELEYKNNFLTKPLTEVKKDESTDEIKKVPEEIK